MLRQTLLQLAASGHRAPIGADLVLREHQDAAAILLDGRRLGEVVALAAERYHTPLAFPLMDLRLEKADLIHLLGEPEEAADEFHFDAPPPEQLMALLEERASGPFTPKHQAHIDAVRYIARETDKIPIGMAIGPFSLATKLLPDPVTAIALAGMGHSGSEEPLVLAAERCLRMAEIAVARSVAAQMKAGAKALILCEPAASTAYLSPRQIANGSPVWEQFVMQPLLRVKKQLEDGGADLILHDCGELSQRFVEDFGVRVHPAMLSLGSSRKLWDDASLVPKDVVLYGNLPTRLFYSDLTLPVSKVRAMTQELIARMREADHPFILGSECDVLDVPGCEETIRHKVRVFLECP